MPISIKELHIKINVQEDGPSNVGPGKSSPQKSDQMVQEILDQIHQIQQRKQER